MFCYLCLLGFMCIGVYFYTLTFCASGKINYFFNYSGFFLVKKIGVLYFLCLSDKFILCYSNLLIIKFFLMNYCFNLLNPLTVSITLNVLSLTHNSPTVAAANGKWIELERKILTDWNRFKLSGVEGNHSMGDCGILSHLLKRHNNILTTDIFSKWVKPSLLQKTDNLVDDKKLLYTCCISRPISCHISCTRCCWCWWCWFFCLNKAQWVSIKTRPGRDCNNEGNCSPNKPCVKGKAILLCVKAKKKTNHTKEDDDVLK